MPHTPVPQEPVAHTWQLGMGIPFKVVGQEPGQKGGREAGRKGSQPPCPTSLPGLPNNGGEAGTWEVVVGRTGHAPAASTLLLPEPSSLPPAGTCLPVTVVCWSLVPQLPATELPALPGNCPAFYHPLPSTPHPPHPRELLFPLSGGK